jgi:hypothetical protein
MESVFFENYAFFQMSPYVPHIFSKNECSGFKEGLNKIDNVILSRYKKNTISCLMGDSTSKAMTIIYYSGI